MKRGERRDETTIAVTTSSFRLSSLLSRSRYLSSLLVVTVYSAP